MEESQIAFLYGEELHQRKKFKKLISSARVHEIEKRSELDSLNGRILDEHDQFYRDHKLLLTLFRVSKLLLLLQKFK